MAKKRTGPTRILTLDQKTQRLKLAAFEMDNEVVFSFFDKKVPAEERDETLLRALYIGVLALLEDRLSSFFASTTNELGTQLESLKMLFEMKKEIFFKSAVKGIVAEEDVIAYLNQFIKDQGWKDEALGTGTMAGVIPKNKTGDVLCSVEGTDRTIVLEVKFDKSYKLGEIESKDLFTRKADTAWSQILESKANRDSAVGIIVFDKSLVDAGIARSIGGPAGFIRGVGFVAIVDSLAGDYTGLAVAYSLARDIVLHARDLETENEALAMLVGRILRDCEGLVSMKKHVLSITKAADRLMDDLDKGTLSMEFTMKYLHQFLETGTLTNQDLFDFYAGAEVKERYKALKLDAEK